MKDQTLCTQRVVTHGNIPVPQDGVVFLLTLNGDATNPIDMLRSDGIINVEKDWKFIGPIVRGVRTQQFMLVTIGNQTDGDAVNRALAKHGTPALGQWRQAFNRIFSLDYDKGPIGFTGSVWLYRGGNRRFPGYCNVDGLLLSQFFWFDRQFDSQWRFVVEVTG